MDWQNRQSIGFSVRSMEELSRIAWIKEKWCDDINLVEIKVDRFAKNNTPLYKYDRKKGFTTNNKNLELIAKKLKKSDISASLHLPFENIIDINSETGLSIGVVEHHDIYLRKLEMLEFIFRTYGIGRVLTLHPPQLSSNGKKLLDEKIALENAKIFFNKLDAIRIARRARTIIGVENQSDPKRDGSTIGYLPSHFKTMLRDTRTIGLTIDAGHRRLTKNFSVREFLSLGIPIVDVHFHGNSGNFDPETYDDDEHLPPTPENIKGYDNYLRFFRRHRVPITLEISHLEKYGPDKFTMIVERLVKEIK